MKKIAYALAALALLLTGCNGFLEEDNRSNTNSEDYYKTPEGFATLVNAAYASLRDIYGDKPTILLAGTDLYLEGRARGHTESPLGMYKTLEPTDGTVLEFYETCYQAIGRANAVLYYGKKHGNDQPVAAPVGRSPIPARFLLLPPGTAVRRRAAGERNDRPADP